MMGVWWATEAMGREIFDLGSGQRGAQEKLRIIVRREERG